MRTGLAFSFGLLIVMVASCTITLPNGVFLCGQDEDCPGGYSCWSDSYCRDTAEVCVRKTCAEAVAELTQFGVECGELNDGCGGTLDCDDCPEGEACGAAGSQFECGCLELSCSSAAECGTLQARCQENTTISCGTCLGAEECNTDTFLCECPVGVDCNSACEGGCDEGEVCISDQGPPFCCTPQLPCQQNSCSPDEGFDNGCGGTIHCEPGCASGLECVQQGSGSSPYVCVTSCEANGSECGVDPQSGMFCGECEDGLNCVSNQCVCQDAYESNGSVATAAELDCGDACQESDLWNTSIDASQTRNDVDWYVAEVVHAETVVGARLTRSDNDEQTKWLSYLCADGSPGFICLTGTRTEKDGLTVCATTSQTPRLIRRCSGIGIDGSKGGKGTVYVGLSGNGVGNACDGYKLNVFSSLLSEGDSVPPGE